MTQNTQTTAERIFALIFENIGYTDGDDRTVAAIAAEIDALTAERDKAQAEVERLRLPAEAWEADEHYGNLLWSLPVERDTAQEEKLQQAATKRRETSDAAHAGARAREATRERRQELENELESVRDDFRKLTAERNALKAEAERLRPAAEAFEWWENYASNPSTTTWDIFQTAAQRARAAKEAKS